MPYVDEESGAWVWTEEDEPPFEGSYSYIPDAIEEFASKASDKIDKVIDVSPKVAGQAAGAGVFAGFLGLSALAATVYTIGVVSGVLPTPRWARGK